MNDRKYILVSQDKLDNIEALVDELHSIVNDLKYNASGVVSMPYYISPKPHPGTMKNMLTDEELENIF